MQLPQCQELLVDQDAGILTLTLNRPRKRNAMNLQLVEELMAVFDAIAEDRSFRAVILRGAEGNFCSGGDISGMNKEGVSEQDAARITWEFNRVFGRMITRVNRAPQLVVTLLEGAADIEVKVVPGVKCTVGQVGDGDGDGKSSPEHSSPNLCVFYHCRRGMQVLFPFASVGPRASCTPCIPLRFALRL